MMNYWDQRFSDPSFRYGTTANAFLRDQASRLLPGSTVLVPGDGEGRNGVWLAEQGHRVTAVDNSSLGLAKARTLAAERGVSIETVHSDLSEWSPMEESVDALVLIYVHFPPSVRAAIHQKLLSALRVGGLLILEAFHPNQIGRTSGGPKDVTMLYTLDLLRSDLAAVPNSAFEELLAWEGETRLDEGPGHHGDALVTRLVARRIAQPR
jgi:SAM-dependent methyltransferase